ncbi:MAG: nucleotidyl transferase AbiEii/AbiGii toxin family protein, partial [Patescibacteria group bacterium]
MGWQEINKSKYIEQLKKHFNLANSESILEKDLLLTLILAEFEKLDLGKELIFKGGTLLSRNYLKYHRFSEDLDFVFKDSTSIRELTRSARER